MYRKSFDKISFTPDKTNFTEQYALHYLKTYATNNTHLHLQMMWFLLYNYFYFTHVEQFFTTEL